MKKLESIIKRHTEQVTRYITDDVERKGLDEIEAETLELLKKYIANLNRESADISINLINIAAAMFRENEKEFKKIDERIERGREAMEQKSKRFDENWRKKNFK